MYDTTGSRRVVDAAHLPDFGIVGREKRLVEVDYRVVGPLRVPK